MPAFRLQALLDYRLQLEEQQMLRLATVEAERAVAQRALDDWQVRREEQCRRLDQLGAETTLDPYRLREAVDNLGHLEAAIVRQGEVVREVDERVAQERAALMGCVRDRRVLERLRDQHAEQVRLAADRAEARRADELSTMRFGRFTGSAVEAEGV